MHFHSPHLLWLLALLAPMTAYYVWRTLRGGAALRISSIEGVARAPRSVRYYLRHLPFVLRSAAFACIVVALARPQQVEEHSTTSTEGIDIVLSIDVSGSMLARDFKPDRLEAAKKIASKFVNSREDDNMGLVVFAGEAFSAVPMTTDRAALANYISALNREMLEDGTAIGDGLATSINRIKEGKAKSKSVILLTDGSNNTGIVAPLTAAEIAHKMGIKVYTIGIGTNGTAPYPQVNMFGRVEYVPQPVVIDEATLKQIASITGGKYFRATGNKVLAEVFAEIDKLEKSELDVRHFSHTEDNYLPWALAALALFLLELVLRQTYLRSIP